MSLECNVLLTCTKAVHGSLMEAQKQGRLEKLLRKLLATVT